MISDAPVMMGFMAYAGVDQYGTIESKLNPRFAVFMESHDGNISKNNMDSKGKEISQNIPTEVVDAAKDMKVSVAKPSTNGQLSPDLRGINKEATKSVKGLELAFPLNESGSSSKKK